jgi:hypothetical protein
LKDPEITVSCFLFVTICNAGVFAPLSVVFQAGILFASIKEGNQELIIWTVAAKRGSYSSASPDGE